MNLIIYEGVHYTIEALVLGDGASPAHDFLKTVAPPQRARLGVLFERLANHRMISDERKFKKIEESDGIFEFKVFQTRVFCFFAPGKKVVLTHGLSDKKQHKLRRSEIERAERYRKWYVSQRDED